MKVGAPQREWQHQADIVRTVVNPVPMTDYLLLDTPRPCRIIGLYIRVIWSVQPVALNLDFYPHLQMIRHTIGNPVSTTSYYPHKVSEYTHMQQRLSTVDHANEAAFLYEFKKLRLVMSVWIGTSSELQAILKYSLKV